MHWLRPESSGGKSNSKNYQNNENCEVLILRLYLVRHGEAEFGTDDPGLTVRGFEQAKKSAAFARENGLRPIQIFHSRKRRARETAEEFASVIHPQNDLLEMDGLSPNDDPAKWADIIEQEEADLMLVGHMPYMPALASLLLAGDKNKGLMNFENAAILSLVKIGHGRWMIEWFVNPNILPGTPVCS